MNRGAQQTIVHRVKKGSDTTEHVSMILLIYIPMLVSIVNAYVLQKYMC